MQQKTVGAVKVNSWKSGLWNGSDEHFRYVGKMIGGIASVAFFISMFTKKEIGLEDPIPKSSKWNAHKETQSRCKDSNSFRYARKWKEF